MTLVAGTKRAAWRIRQAGWAETHAAWRRAPVRPDVVLYESFSGNGMLCNPEAIFRYLIELPEFSHLIHVWVVRDPKDPKLVQEFGSNPQVHFVKYGSTAYLKHLAVAGYLINNATFPGWFSKRPGQTYLNTWHGTPIKKMGYTMPDGATTARNVVRNFLAADYLLSSSHRMTEQMYETGYRLRNIFRGKILEEGSPRTDRQLAPNAAHEATRMLAAVGLPIAGKRIVLYAPTWKGESFLRPEDQSAHVAETVAKIREALPDDWLVLTKVHQIVYDAASRHVDLQDCLIPNGIPTNVVLACTNLLVTDYSSIIFDYLLLDRPIVFYVPDSSDYAVTRGLYVAPEEMPGVLAPSETELQDAVRRVSEGKPESSDIVARRREWVQRYAPHDDGEVTARVVDAVFRSSPNHRLVDISSDGRQRILIYVGPMISNGITTSALSLLSNIDYERFDVSALYLNPTDDDQTHNVARLDEHVRHLPKIDGMNGSKLLHARRHLLQLSQVRPNVAHPGEFPVAQLFRDEWTRCFGDARFDYVIDFSGYGPLWDLILLQGQAKSHSIWLHNDMYADSRRTVHGRRHLFRRLHSVFSTYRFFDHLVSVSRELAGVNAKRLPEYASPEQFTYAHNTIDYQRIRSMAEREPVSKAPGAWQWRRTDPDQTTFVTVGRLSTEKNHERLIRAFAQVHAEHPRTRLLILGDGPLREHLVGIVLEQGLDDSVELAGFQTNPYHPLVGSDCFVLSSDHEGQPMVILEALTLGLPVLITDFSSSKGALPAGTGLIVERSEAGLVRGMNSFLEDGISNPEFDPVEYNQRAMAEFYAAIGVSKDLGY